jgi:transcriptional antiterminator RfaH
MDAWAETNWYAVHTKPCREDGAAMNIRRMGIEVLLPKMEREKLVYGLPHRLIKPLFPGYLFARFRPVTYLHMISYARGVHKVVSACGIPIVVEDRIIDSIQSRISAEGIVRIKRGIPFRRGGRVRVEEGPLKGLEGVFCQELSDKQRALILLDAIGYQGRVLIDQRSLKSTAPAV